MSEILLRPCSLAVCSASDEHVCAQALPLVGRHDGDMADEDRVVLRSLIPNKGIARLRTSRSPRRRCSQKTQSCGDLERSHLPSGIRHYQAHDLV